MIAAAWMHCCGYKNISAALVDIGTLRPVGPNPPLLKSIKELL
jgi:ferredoxin-fold anticodon binding domain-containing protein